MSHSAAYSNSSLWSLTSRLGFGITLRTCLAHGVCLEYYPCRILSLCCRQSSDYRHNTHPSSAVRCVCRFPPHAVPLRLGQPRLWTGITHLRIRKTVASSSNRYVIYARVMIISGTPQSNSIIKNQKMCLSLPPHSPILANCLGLSRLLPPRGLVNTSLNTITHSE